jgi:LacI family transcriptional regulator
MSRTNEGPLPTIEDVALAAGVSTATVSRVLNQPHSVRAVLRERVIQAVGELGYVPHAGARALSLRRSDTVGAIFPTVDNAIFAQAIDALQRRLAEDGLQLLIATCDYDREAEARQAVTLVTRGVDALVLCGFGQRPQLLQFLRQRSLPCVHVISFAKDADDLCVGFDNRRAASRGVKHLTDLGHRRVAMLAGLTQDNDRAAARVAGARDALQAAGLSLPPHRLVERRYDLAEAREGFRALMAARPAPTALFCGNDVLAFGALLEAQRIGIDVPRSLSILGFDDLELSSHLSPSLSTVRVPVQTMWRLAAERLIAALRGELPPQCTELDVELVVRESTARVPRAARAAPAA